MANAGDQRTTTATRLGSYEIVCKLAEGGMAELFLARTIGPLGFEKLVVLKKILPHFAANPKFVQLFLEEAKLAAGLDHPHIAHVYDMGMIDGNYFFTMEYIHGQDLRAILRRTSRRGKLLPIEHVVQVIRDVAAALHYAHERRRADGQLLDIVHRDVSPSNVLVSYDGAVKLLDFGVAKAASSSVKTRTGTLKGKIGYMSPEQAKGGTIDRRSDLFSLGVMAWEMVATRRLFKAENDLATLQQIINTPAPLARTARADCPEELERIIARALSSKLDERYQTAQDMQVDLEEFAREHRLSQSSIILSRFVVELFDNEHAAWKKAQASGATLIEFVASGSVADATTPISSSDLAAGSFEDDAADDGADDVADPDETEELDDAAEVSQIPAAMVRATPVPSPPSTPSPIAHVPLAHVPVPGVPSPIAHVPSAPIAHAGFPSSTTGPFVAPTPGLMSRPWTRPVLVGAGLAALVVIATLARGGKGAKPGPVEERAEPSVAQPASGSTEAPAIPDAGVASSETKPSIAKPETKPVAKPETKSVVKAETRPVVKAETKPVVKAETKPVVKPTKPKPKPFDPNDPLPPK